MARMWLSDQRWSRLRLGILKNGAYSTYGLRMNVEGILYKLRTGCPWRDLPFEFGSWNSVFKKFNDWRQKGKLLNLFQSLLADPLAIA
jgi:transposase